MRAFRKAGLVVGLLVAASVARAGDLPGFHLDFSGPTNLGDLRPGETASGECLATLEQTGVIGEVGAQGWSLSLGFSGDIVLTGVTTAGTQGVHSGGFEKTELTPVAGPVDGAVSAVVLHFTKPVTLDPTVVSSILALSFDTTATEIGSYEGAIFFEDGHRGSGQPVDNNITFGGQTVNPTLGSKTITYNVIEVVECPTGGPGVEIFVQAEPIAGSPAQSENLLENAVAPNSEGPALLQGFVPEGEQHTKVVYWAIGSNLDAATGGVQGWSLSAGVDGELTLIDATTAGTAGARSDRDPAGLQSGGFEKTQIVDPDLESSALPGGPQGQGAVSAIVLSFTKPVTLAPVGSATVLALTLQGPPQPAGEGSVVAGTIVGRDGLQGAGQPVQSVATVNGETVPFNCIQTARVECVTVSDLRQAFIRGNANNDNKVDIADPIYIVSALFRDGPAISCEDAADANDDGGVDLTDVTYLVTYQFLGGAAPPAPFPGCGRDGGDEGKDDDGLGCESTQTVCAP